MVENRFGLPGLRRPLSVGRAELGEKKGGEEVRTAIFCALLAALALFGVWADRRWNPRGQVQPERVDEIAAILQADKTEDRLIDRWPDAPIIMRGLAEMYDLPPALLPAIARAEGMTEGMHHARNPYGLTYQGRLLEYCDYFHSTAAAAKLLDKNRERWEDGDGVDVDRLARWYCPVNWRQWARNVEGAMR